MITLPLSLAAWSNLQFKQTFKNEVEALDATILPLQQGLAVSSYVSNEPFHILVLSYSDNEQAIQVRTGVSYSGIISGCSCADDPTPMDVQTEYCELMLSIDKNTADTHIALLTD